MQKAMSLLLDKGQSRPIIAGVEARGVLRNQLAHILATAKHEIAHTMEPVIEYGSDAYLKSKRYWRWIGRGFVQLTWKENYIRAAREGGRCTKVPR